MEKASLFPLPLTASDFQLYIVYLLSAHRDQTSGLLIQSLVHKLHCLGWDKEAVCAGGWR